MSDAYIQDILQRYQRGECTPAEQREVEHWYAALEQHVPSSPPLTAQERQTLQEALWARIAQQTELETPVIPLATATKPWYVRAPVRWAAAAAVAVGVGLAALQQLPGSWVASTTVQQETAQSEWTIRTEPGQLTLPDGSTVVLAPDSRLRYPRRFVAARRQVFLSGEATFDVSHNPQHPFEVYTEQMLTTVLGTSFTVQAYAGQPETRVQVLRGKVRVQPRKPVAATAAAPPAAVDLLPNQQAVYSPAAHALRKDLVAQPALLALPTTLSFDDQPVAEVIATLEHAYGVEILYDEAALAHCTVSVVLQKDQLFNNLDLLCKTLGATYRSTDAHVQLYSQGCKS
ncbi:FecR domain-containing protein [Hymenobacter aerilatus]|uniref:FecR domain-containing protein n=1 Tax=Hymenobacter aerilatus TaxID=2932251 RepID=A0A8T9T0E2_9BACT|nr:FecR domain-containing protein [Hymenobacter aerilatus]UOR07327.1 FecR domain-containing protein [Hymenobacter aerilatus]